MKKILVFITLLIIPTIIMAEECSNTDLVELKKKASKIEFKLVPDYVINVKTDPDTGEQIEYKENTFDIMITNLTDDFKYLLIENDSITPRWNSTMTPFYNNTFRLSVNGDYSTVGEEKLYILSTKCDDKLIAVLTIIVPKRNPYYDMVVCDGISDYYLCQEFLYEDYQVSFSDVKKSTEKYREGKVDEQGKKKANKSFMDYIEAFTSKYYIPLIIILVIAGGTVVYINVKRRKRLKKHFN